MVIILLMPFITGCAALKRKTIEESLENGKNEVRYKEISELNLTNRDFHVTKAEIEIIVNNEKEKLLGNIKYNNSGNYLISIRNRSGIEGARIFITPDTIMINDRINKKIYYGSTNYLNNKYGITKEILPVILGDFIVNIKEEKVNECKKNRAYINDRIKGKEVNYTIDCGKMKVVEVTIYDEITKKNIEIAFRRFEKTDEYSIARNIKIKSNNKEEHIEINIEKLKLGLESDIIFIPGNKYEKILLR